MSDNMFDDYEENEVSRHHFTFSYENYEDDRRITVNRSFPSDSPWHGVLQEFVDFLSGIYGYDVSDRVRVQAYPFEYNMSESGWHGGTFRADEK